jgi:hypothetical protein
LNCTRSSRHLRQAPHVKTALQRHAEGGGHGLGTPKADALVYELYGLTDEEIAVVEG